MAAVGFSIQHDGGHHAYSRLPPGSTGWPRCRLDLIGASSYLWRWKHDVFHHTYTNVTGQDTDIDVGRSCRLAPDQRRRWFHRWQHLYLWPLYAMHGVPVAPVRRLQGRASPGGSGRTDPPPEGLGPGPSSSAARLFSIGLLLGVPMLFHPWWVVLLFYLLVTAVVGGGDERRVPARPLRRGGRVPACPTADTRRMERRVGGPPGARRPWTSPASSRVLCWLLGGLNFQIEHHLFPQVCHVHYPAMSRIVEETCREYGVRYSAHPTFLAGLRSHYRWLERMGRPDPVPAVA